MRRRLSVLLIVPVVALVCAQLADAGPYECRNPAYAQAHTDECSTSGPPFLLGGPSSGDRGSGGLIGAIGRALGGIL